MPKLLNSANSPRITACPLMNIYKSQHNATVNIKPSKTKSIPEQLWDRRRDFRATQPIMLDFPDGITYWICPPGFANGWNEFSNRGLSLWPEVTCWPKKHHFALYYGYNNVAQIHTRNGSTLWPLELMVYIRERASALTRALEALENLKTPLPRKKGHDRFDVTPFPEDFRFEADEEQKQ